MVPLEEERLKVSRESWLYSLFILIGALLSGVVLFSWLENLFWQILSALFLAALPVVYWIDKRGTFKNKVRLSLVEQALKSIPGTRYEREPDAESLPIEEMDDLNLLPAFSRMEHLEDHVSGTHRGIDFQWVECDFTKGYGRYKRTVFSGNLLSVQNCPLQLPAAFCSCIAGE